MCGCGSGCWWRAAARPARKWSFKRGKLTLCFEGPVCASRKESTSLAIARHSVCFWMCRQSAFVSSSSQGRDFCRFRSSPRASSDKPESRAQEVTRKEDGSPKCRSQSKDRHPVTEAQQLQARCAEAEAEAHKKRGKLTISVSICRGQRSEKSSPGTERERGRWVWSHRCCSCRRLGCCSVG